MAFVAFGELCILTNKQEMARWKVDSESEFRLSATNRTFFTSRQPLIVWKEVLIADFARVMKFSLETYSFL